MAEHARSNFVEPATAAAARAEFIGAPLRGTGVVEQVPSGMATAAAANKFGTTHQRH